uniref:ATP synthase complex subunit 8 n=2 Tax=Teleogryllus TaxID=82804 RepID=B8QI02_9ORTH|nr:ATP synthase F0 subunit 8 [Teleogryllus emma]YP_009186318.1 ATP synthase F0 subunit 8 [Teleogryllus oceanicus]ACB12515.1 ATP synthase F0 subunit 8 [Teleogryllus emma]ALO71665.1 ATP synthase F0 subunit 8 [Teleogryllus oceanicus]
MPQMAPMMWMSLMIFFIMTLMIIMTMNYFLNSANLNKKKMYFKINSTNWKW